MPAFTSVNFSCNYSPVIARSVAVASEAWQSNQNAQARWIASLAMTGNFKQNA
jgi:hypothetical protein